MGAGGLRTQDIEDHFAVLDPAAGRDVVTENDLGAVVMGAVMEGELTGLAVNCPTGEAAGDFLHVFLSVAGVDAEGMEFHDFTSVVLVDATALLAHHRDGRGRGGRGAILHQHGLLPFGRLLLLRRNGVGKRAAGVIEVIEHGRALGIGLEQVAEFAPDVGANDVAIIGNFVNAADVLFDIDVKVIIPKIGEHFLELPLRVNGTDELGLFKFADGRNRAILIGFGDHGVHLILGALRGGNLDLRRRRFDLVLTGGAPGIGLGLHSRRLSGLRLRYL